VSPAARKLAKELGIDIAQVRPSGRSGRITSEDVLAYQQHAKGSERAAGGGGRAIRFHSDGLALAGVLHVPPRLAAGERRAGVVLCTGIQGLKELAMPELAQALAAAGFVALSFDYRGFGASEGPRWRLMPHEQVRDTRAALTFLSLQPEVDPARLGLLGFSFGGGHALSAAAEDERARAVAAVEPVTSGRRWLRSLRREWEWREFLEELARDRAARVTGAASREASLYEVMQPDPETRVGIEAVGKQRVDLEMEPRITLECAEAIVDYLPEAMAARIAPRATLVIHGEMDVLVPIEESLGAIAAAGEPKRLVVLPGMGHLNWQRPGHPVFERVTAILAEWFDQHLR
jgi:alpha-beta hydrolase superfamily lysophospholipase